MAHYRLHGRHAAHYRRDAAHYALQTIHTTGCTELHTTRCTVRGAHSAQCNKGIGDVTSNCLTPRASSTALRYEYQGAGEGVFLSAGRTDKTNFS